MRASLSLALIFLVVLPAAGAQRARDKRAELSDAQRGVLENEVIPAYQMGNRARILTALQPLVQRLSPAQLEVADALLQINKAPTVTELLSSARISLLEQNQLGKLPPPRNRELILTLKGIKDRIDELLELRTTHIVFKDKSPLPDTFLKFERRFWEMHVIERLLESGDRMTHYAEEWQKGGQRMSKKNLSPEDQEVLATDFKAVNNELKGLMRELAERTLELRLRRLEFAVDRLVKSKDLKERFQAAFAVDIDGELLGEFLFEPPDKDAIANRERIVFRTTLADAALAPRVQELIKQGREAAGDDLLHKSRLLFTGLHWWYRGRYGLGTEGYGLLKSAAALKFPEAQFLLYMPRDIPDPAEAQGQDGQHQRGLQYPRRHYQLWQFESRDVAQSYQHYLTPQQVESEFFT